jgi:hypothetical protein
VSPPDALLQTLFFYLCHSERSEESSEISRQSSAAPKWILHCVQNDNPCLAMLHESTKMKIMAVFFLLNQ